MAALTPAIHHLAPPGESLGGAFFSFEAIAADAVDRALSIIPAGGVQRLAAVVESYKWNFAGARKNRMNSALSGFLRAGTFVGLDAALCQPPDRFGAGRQIRLGPAPVVDFFPEILAGGEVVGLWRTRELWFHGFPVAHPPPVTSHRTPSRCINRHMYKWG